MKQLPILGILSVAIAVACLGLGYSLAGYWLIVAVLAGMVLFWLFTKKWAVFGRASSLLFVYVGVAGAGVLLHLSLPLMVVGCTCALASWELALFAGSGGSHPSLLRERSHLRSLGAMMAISIGAGFVSLVLELRLPFVAVAVLVLLAVGGLIGGMSYWRRGARG